MALGRLLVVRSPLRGPAALAVVAALLLSPAGARGALAATPGPGPRPSPAASPSSEAQAPPGLEPAQEVTLEALGVGSQVVQGSSGSVEVFLPPPDGPLAPSGSFVRVFFGHSPLLDAATSSLTLAVNGQPLTSVRLDGSSTDGSAFEARVASSVLRGDRPNLLQARFELNLAGEPATGDSAAYARLEPQTLLHYQLYGPPGSRPPPRLESYPFPFVSRAGDSGMGLVLPTPASAADLEAAFRLAADLGRRQFTRQPRPEVLTGGADAWLRSAGRPAILVGTLGKLPLAARVLEAAGFSRSASGWTSPDAQQVQVGDGLLAAATSPFDGQSPVLLVSGFSDAGLARAASALAGTGTQLPAGSYAVLRPGAAFGAGVSSSWPGAGSRLSLAGLATASAAGPGGGSRYLVYPFAAPPVDPGRSGALQLRLRGAAPAVALNGQSLAGAVRTSPSGQEGTLRQPFPGSMLRPGLNVLAVRLAPPAPSGPGTLLDGSLELPPAPRGTAGLEMLPDPVLADSGGLLVTVARLDDGVLGAAALALAALGSRGAAPRSLRVVDARAFDPRALARSSLLTVGGSGGSGPLERLRRQLPTTVRQAMQWSAAGSGPAAVLAEQQVPAATAASSEAHFLLWLDGSSAPALQTAAAALYRHPLPGRALNLDAAGRLHALRTEAGAGPSVSQPPAPLRLLLPALAVMAVAAMLAGLAWQLRAPLEPAW